LKHERHALVATSSEPATVSRTYVEVQTTEGLLVNYYFVCLESAEELSRPASRQLQGFYKVFAMAGQLFLDWHLEMRSDNVLSATWTKIAAEAKS